jgi:FdhD protein
MTDHEQLEPAISFEVVRHQAGTAQEDTTLVATEVPLTVVANDIEVATIACTPAHIRELVYGFLFTQGLIGAADDVYEVLIDPVRWRVDTAIARTPDTELLNKRLYTSGCGKGVMFTTIFEIAARSPMESDFRIAATAISDLMRWLQAGSTLHRMTGGVHSAVLETDGRRPDAPIDDVGRHNAVDKVIGAALLEGADFTSSILATSGRISSEILFKARRCGIPLVASFGAPTHQAVLLAREMHVTLVGFARGRKLTVFSHPGRVAGGAG